MNKLSSPYQELLERLSGGDRLALARLMTLIESRPPEVYALMSQVCGLARGVPRLGITGPPGAGKSTLIDQIIRSLRAGGKTVGAIVIDPSSPFSGGAVLGDRVRMQDHSLDPGVFVRSLASRGSHGGVSRATMEVAVLLDAFGMDEIIIETVGVGQTELDIMGIANTTAVVLVPESGDTIQTLKAGILEIGQVFVVNKADREGAERIASELQGMLKIAPSPDGWSAPVILCQAREGKGINEFLSAVQEHRHHLEARPDLASRQAEFRKQQLIEILLAEIRHRLVASSSSPGNIEAGLTQIFDLVKNAEKDPYQAAAELLADPQKLARVLGINKVD
jgi:LAO/AO transport system kinase